MRKKRAILKKWCKTEIARVKLNPEQAVLSCCDSILRNATSVTFTACSSPICTGEDPEVGLS
ncbi:MAG: hypothetical protein WC214_06080 [Candidatus Omnitrophota bacterium]